jgi:hypothetical protein
MANLTAALGRKPYGKGGRDISHGVDGGTATYEGGLISQLTATGMLVPTSTSGAGPAIGVATHDQDNTAGSDGALRLTVETDRIFIFANGTSTDACSEATLIGSPVYAFDDHTVYDNDASGTLAVAGLFMGMEPDGTVRVYVSSHRMAAAATIAALTDNSAGTANNTIQALPDPTDTPATADALRDDLVAVLIPALRNNFADLAAKVNEIRTVLRASGLML